MYNVSQEAHSFRQCYLLYREGLDEPPMERLSYVKYEDRKTNKMQQLDVHY